MMVADALDMMQDSFHRVLPVVDDEGFLLGVVKENTLLDVLNPNVLISSFTQNIEPALEGAHLFDLLKQMQFADISVFPIVDADKKYLGCVTQETIIGFLGRESSVTDPGGIIILDIKAVNYSMAEVARIIESSHAVILHSFVTPTLDRERILLTLKLNKVDLKEVLLTFERFEYQIVAVFHVSEYEQGLQERYESLMMYLNI